MRILCDKPSLLKDALYDKFNQDFSVDYSPALDIYTKWESLQPRLRLPVCG